MINHKQSDKELLTNEIMKKEEICVLIDTPEKAKKAHDILTNAGEIIYCDTLKRLQNGMSSDEYKFLYFFNKKWYGIVDNLGTIISLKQLKNLLKPKEFVIPINNESEYLKVKEVAEFLGYKEGNTYRVGEKNVIFINGKFSSHIHMGIGWKPKSYQKFINKMPEKEVLNNLYVNHFITTERSFKPISKPDIEFQVDKNITETQKYFRIDQEKEQKDITTLIEKLRPFITPETIIVNCSPDYSSVVSQRVIHAYYNNPLEMVNFNMPFPNTPFEKEYPKYCRKFAKKIYPESSYVFIDSGVLRGKNFLTLAQELSFRGLRNDNIIFASLYVQDDAIFTPGVYVEKFNKANQGMLLFHWENENCTLFD
jgi:predicted DNA-binding transcriptional regulator AlpA